jgi:hypothetical protein
MVLFRQWVLLISCHMCVCVCVCVCVCDYVVTELLMKEEEGGRDRGRESRYSTNNSSTSRG